MSGYDMWTESEIIARLTRERDEARARLDEAADTIDRVVDHALDAYQDNDFVRGVCAEATDVAGQVRAIAKGDAT